MPADERHLPSEQPDDRTGPTWDHRSSADRGPVPGRPAGPDGADHDRSSPDEFAGDRLQVGDDLVSGWLQVGDDLVSGWLEAGDEIDEIRMADAIADPNAVGASRLLDAARGLAGAASRPMLFIDHLRQPVAAAAFGCTDPGDDWTTCVVEGGSRPPTMLEAAGSALDLIDLVGWEMLLGRAPAMVVAVTETDDADGFAVAVQHPDGHRSWSETGVIGGARLDGAARALEQAAADCMVPVGPAADDPRFEVNDDR